MFDRFEESLGGFAPEIVEDDVDAGVEFGAIDGDERCGILVSLDDGVSSESFEMFEGAAGCCDDAGACHG